MSQNTNPDNYPDQSTSPTGKNDEDLTHRSSGSPDSPILKESCEQSLPPSDDSQEDQTYQDPMQAGSTESPVQGQFTEQSSIPQEENEEDLSHPDTSHRCLSSAHDGSLERSSVSSERNGGQDLVLPESTLDSTDNQGEGEAEAERSEVAVLRTLPKPQREEQSTQELEGDQESAYQPEGQAMALYNQDTAQALDQQPETVGTLADWSLVQLLPGPLQQLLRWLWRTDRWRLIGIRSDDGRRRMRLSCDRHHPFMVELVLHELSGQILLTVQLQQATLLQLQHFIGQIRHQLGGMMIMPGGGINAQALVVLPSSLQQAQTLQGFLHS